MAADIASLGLNDTARQGAEALLRQFPDIVFTSGRRGLADQARAMAQNVAKPGERKWIEETYRSDEASQACQKWVDEHPTATTADAIQAGLLQTLTALGPKAGQISKHLTGDAFDVQPVTQNADAIKQAIRKLPGMTLFLDHEGGLVRWHVEF